MRNFIKQNIYKIQLKNFFQKNNFIQKSKKLQLTRQNTQQWCNPKKSKYIALTPFKIATDKNYVTKRKSNLSRNKKKRKF